MDVTSVPGTRFGLTADTHDVLVEWPAAAVKLASAWGRVDAIVHCGDLTSMAAIDTLGAIAPVYATRNKDDPPAAPPRLTDGPRVLGVGGLRIGVVFVLPEEARTGDGAARLFGGAVDVCVHGGTHEASEAVIDGVLFINPGSPTLARTRTAAILTLAGGRPSVEIVGID